MNTKCLHTQTFYGLLLVASFLVDISINNPRENFPHSNTLHERRYGIFLLALRTNATELNNNFFSFSDISPVPSLGAER